MNDFECSKCGRLRIGGLWYRGLQCKVCESYRWHLQDAAHPRSFDEHEAEFMVRMDRSARGVKVCPVCSTEKPLSDFHANGRCHPCRREERIQQKRGARRRKAEAEGRVIGGGHRQHDAHVRALHHNFTRECKALSRQLNAIMNAKPWHGLTAAQAFAVRYRMDKEFHIKQRMRLQFRKHMVRGAKHILGIPTPHKRYSFQMDQVLGYTAADFVRHIEPLFTDGMTWDAFFAGSIHIDHKRPISSFNLDDPAQFKACFALSNLQPLWAQDNMSKGDTMECGRLGRHVRGMAA